MDFIKNNRYLGAAPKEKSISSYEEIKPLVVETEIVAEINTPHNNTIETVIPKIDSSNVTTIMPVENTPAVTTANTGEIETTIENTGTVENIETTSIENLIVEKTKEVFETKETPPLNPEIHRENGSIFNDIAIDSPFYEATKYLAEQNVAYGYTDGGFHPSEKISRSETILLYDRLFKARE